MLFRSTHGRAARVEQRRPRHTEDDLHPFEVGRIERRHPHSSLRPLVPGPAAASAPPYSSRSSTGRSAPNLLLQHLLRLLLPGPPPPVPASAIYADLPFIDPHHHLPFVDFRGSVQPDVRDAVGGRAARYGAACRRTWCKGWGRRRRPRGKDAWGRGIERR